MRREEKRVCSGQGGDEEARRKGMRRVVSCDLGRDVRLRGERDAESGKSVDRGCGCLQASQERQGHRDFHSA